MSHDHAGKYSVRLLSVTQSALEPVFSLLPLPLAGVINPWLHRQSILFFFFNKLRTNQYSYPPVVNSYSTLIILHVVFLKQIFWLVLC